MYKRQHHHIDRHSYLIAIGGGALLDVAGFAAATAHRGVRQVRIPTTTLSQADSGVGVKNGINAFGKKNFIGTFALRAVGMQNGDGVVGALERGGDAVGAVLGAAENDHGIVVHMIEQREQRCV